MQEAYIPPWLQGGSSANAPFMPSGFPIDTGSTDPINNPSAGSPYLINNPLFSGSGGGTNNLGFPGFFSGSGFSNTNAGNLPGGVGYGSGSSNPINSTFGNFPNLSGLLGGGLGSWLQNFINSGAGYNQGVLQALIQQLQPQIQSGIATIGSSFGATGNEFGSANALALGDYLSQVNANENVMAANLYENSINNVIGLISELINPQAAYQSNKGGFWSTLGAGLLGQLGGKLINMIPGLGGSSGGGGSNIDWGSVTGGIGGSPIGIGGGVSLPSGGSTIPGTTNTGGFNMDAFLQTYLSGSGANAVLDS